MSFTGNNFNNFNNLGNQSFVRHLAEFVGETVTIFTTSGGASGCGFTGTVLSVNCNFVRLVTRHGTPPQNPLSEEICDDRFDEFDDDDEFDEDDNIIGGLGGGIGGGIGGKIGNTTGGIGGGIGGGLIGGIGSEKRRKRDRRRNRDRDRDRDFRVGSVCDIPIDRIAAFCHNTI